MEDNNKSHRLVSSLTKSEAETLFKIALWKKGDEAIALRIEPDKVRAAIQLSDGEYLFRIYQNGTLWAKMDYQDGAGYQINALGIIRYLESIGVVLEENQ